MSEQELQRNRAAQQQGPRLGGLGQAAASREINMNAVVADAQEVRERLHTLDATVVRLRDHMMGCTEEKGPERIDTGRPEGLGVLPLLCDMGSYNVGLVGRIQEKLNQIAYELGGDK